MPNLLVDSYTRGYTAAMEKLAVKIPVIHGTSGRWDLLKPGIGSTVLKRDPNPRGVYVAMSSRNKLRGIEHFAQSAAASKGGTPVVAHAKIDTRKGWTPRELTAWGKQNLGSLEEARDLVKRLDETPDKASRGELWRQLHAGIGSWLNVDPTTTLKPNYYTDVAPLANPLRKVG